MIFYGRWGSLRQIPSPLAEGAGAHTPTSPSSSNKRFNHAKLYVFDSQTVILGGMGIGDDFRDVNVDFMVEITGGGAAARLADRYEGRARSTPGRPFDYLLHALRGQALTGKALAAQRLELMAGVRERLTIAMAYLGHPSRPTCWSAAVQRGVKVTLLTAARANVGGDLNLATCAELLRRTGSPGNLRIVLPPADGARQGHRGRRRMGRPRLGQLHPAVARRLRGGGPLLPRPELRPARRAGHRERARGRGKPPGSPWPTAAWQRGDGAAWSVRSTHGRKG